MAIIQDKDWRIALQEWLKGNPKIMPNRLKQLREDFIKDFPKEKLSEMTLDQYAVGKHDPKIGSTFCHWIEFRTVELGSIKGGNAAKFGIYWNKKLGKWIWKNATKTVAEAYIVTDKNTDAEEYFQKLKSGLVKLIQATDSNQFDELDRIGNESLGGGKNSLRAKPLYLYFPDKFLPISNQKHLDIFLQYFNQKPNEGLHAKNRQLLMFLSNQSELEGFDTLQMMRFLYDALGLIDTSSPSLDPDTDENSDFDLEIISELNLVQDLIGFTQNTRNLILYGAPGTGKTFTVNQFAKEFLAKQLQSPITPEQRKQDAVQGLTWHEAISLAMYLKKDKEISELEVFPNKDTRKIYGQPKTKKLLKVPELVNDEIIQIYWKTTKTQKLSNMIHAMLQIHTEPSVGTVKYSITKRQEPFLFEKDNQGYWYITDDGKEYVEENLGEQLKMLTSSSLPKADISKYMRFVTFHQSFAYEEFVEGIKPVTNELDEVTYKVVDGIFKEICRAAELDPENKYLIIIDEINRANIAKVFGELITLIEDDKRIGEENELKVTLPYSKEEFGVPKNLYILGTMNTSDRSIALLDIALRRRFTFIELKPEPELLKDKDIKGIQLDLVLTKINKRITALIGRDYQIGHSYFLNTKNLENLHFTWYYKIIPLLQEYFYNDGKRLQAVLGKSFIEAIEPDKSLQETLGEFYRMESQYEEKVLQGDDFIKAMQELH